MTIDLYVQEDIQVAHRLVNLPGKCQQIHGHTMTIYMTLKCAQDDNGYAVDSEGGVLDFSGVKKTFRQFLADNFDHHLALSEEDPLRSLDLPGATYWPGDPCVE